VIADRISIVGVGETDYAADHAAVRGGTPPTERFGYAATALRRALADAGLGKDDLDGLVSGPTLATERLGEVLGIDPVWADQADAVNAVTKAMAAIEAGYAECVALVYGNDQKSVGTRYGGPGSYGSDRHLAYAYFSSWGLTSQGALYALLARAYMAHTGLTEADLGRFVVAQREFATSNPNAVMRRPLALDDYLAAGYICDPLRLFDYCLVNDGGVALVLTSTERAERTRRPVRIAGIGRSDLNRESTSLAPRLLDFYRTAHRGAAERVYGMAGLGPEDIGSVHVYDSFSIHVPVALHGFGFAPGDDIRALTAPGVLGPSGRLRVNTSGGHLSESYMQGWNHLVEAVRQTRGEAGDRQTCGRIAQYISDVAGKTTSLILRGDGR